MTLSPASERYVADVVARFKAAGYPTTEQLAKVAAAVRPHFEARTARSGKAA